MISVPVVWAHYVARSPSLVFWTRTLQESADTPEPPEVSEHSVRVIGIGLHRDHTMSSLVLSLMGGVMTLQDYHKQATSEYVYVGLRPEAGLRSWELTIIGAFFLDHCRKEHDAYENEGGIANIPVPFSEVTEDEEITHYLSSLVHLDVEA